VGLLGPLVGGATALVVGVRRSRDRRRLLSTPAPYAGAYGGYSPPPGFGPPPPPPPGESRFARTAPPGAADPPSLRARVDWSSGDVPLPWRSERP
ncbi:MAG TPA: hypothetical protein VFI47_03550, partial [Acidimicrobiales bacterium]|nr:hypothetical protein [Acidimicrobiales bacterium]